MLLPRRFLVLLAILTAALFLLFYHGTNVRDTWRNLPEKVGLGESMGDAYDDERPTSANADDYWKNQPNSGFKDISNPKPQYKPGVVKAPGSTYTRTLVVPRMKDEDVTWIHEILPGIETAIYVADDPNAPLHPPKNKGHEVMIYLTYIIEHYNVLPDVMIFMHAHRWSWHNNDLLDNDASQMIRQLSSERVTREGYMNMRCHWDPGCPAWMHPGALEEDINKQEEVLLAKSWSELFPLDPIPDVLAQPCCAQFALSKDRVLAIPKSQFIYYRDWLLKTSLSDYISGRVFEYIWQYIFTGGNVFCPAMNVCYCDGFGVCFGGPDVYEAYFERRFKMKELELELEKWHKKEKAIQAAKDEGKLDEAAELEVPELGKDKELEEKIQKIRDDLDKRKAEAVERGKDPKNRALEAGREWHEGDGF